MPEYQVSLEVNLWAQNEEDANEAARTLANYLFADEDVNSVGSGIPIFVKEDE